MSFQDMTERLVALRTPAEIAVSPDGETLASLPCTRRARTAAPMRPATCTRAGRRAAGAADERRSGDGGPVWSPDGHRLAFLSDHITPGHNLPYTMLVDGGDPTPAATIDGSAEAVLWSADGRKLLVMAADAGLYGLDFSARAVLWSSEPTLRSIDRTRPGGACS